MGCGCSGGSSSGTMSSGYAISSPLRTSNVPCDITLENLKTWQKSLECIKSIGKFDVIGVSEFTVNQTLGFIQSAINYQENYCMYAAQLEYFRNVTLINIITHAPECI